MSESGSFYGTLIDPVLRRMRIRVAKYVNPGQSVLDVACGTGAQIFEVAGKAGIAVGFDNSESMIKRAHKIRERKKLMHTEFHIHNATEKWPYINNQFDVAILSLALHQFSSDYYPAILNEMKRVAARHVFVDYAVPLPRNLTGAGAKVAEFLAGREHYKNFRNYNRLGGLSVILPNHVLIAENEEYFANNIFHLVFC